MASVRQTAGYTGQGLTPAYRAVPARIALVVVLLLLAAVGWWWTAQAMSGMDMGPWTGLGALGLFIITWTVMMYAMMFPALAPTVALYSRMTRSRAPLQPVLFSAGYMVVWIGAGLIAYAVGAGISYAFGGTMAWSRAGQLVAAAALLLAAGYQLTPLKNACLNKCRSPLGFLLSSWRDGWMGASWMGAKNGLWCLGCCWAIMTALFALGVMSITWMAVIAAIILLEKLLPWRAVALYGTAALFFVVGVMLLVAPAMIPTLAVPGHAGMAMMMSP